MTTAAGRERPGRQTGPRTPAGKARAAQNARRHGLTIPIRADPAWRDKVLALERALAAEGPRLFAQLAAEATVEIDRIGWARIALVTAIESAANVKTLARLDRYEGRAYAKKAKAYAMLPGLRRAPSLADKLDLVLRSAGPQVAARGAEDVSAVELRKTKPAGHHVTAASFDMPAWSRRFTASAPPPLPEGEVDRALSEGEARAGEGF